jgi:hypothetical protein
MASLSGAQSQPDSRTPQLQAGAFIATPNDPAFVQELTDPHVAEF